MSFPTPTVFYIVIHREDMPGQQHKTYTSIGTLLRWIENVRNDPHHYDFGPFDVFVVDVEALEVGKFDVAPLIALTKRKARGKGKAGA